MQETFSDKKITIGTRGSPLALWQANWIKSQLEAVHDDLTVELVKIKTSGDKILDVPLAKVGGKGLFTKEIEESLLRFETDIAVHSMKDVPVQIPPSLTLSVVTEREDPRDVLMSRKGLKLDDLPKGARVGTGSFRRTTQLLHYRPDLEMVPMRGNLETRLNKLESEGLDAIILAAAGLIRMEMAGRITEYIEPEIMLPGGGQGAIGIESRMEDLGVMNLIFPLDHEESHRILDAERSFLTRLEGGCQVPVGALAVADGHRLRLSAVVCSLDGQRSVEGYREGCVNESERLGRLLAEELLTQGGANILAELRGREEQRTL